MGSSSVPAELSQTCCSPLWDKAGSLGCEKHNWNSLLLGFVLGLRTGKPPDNSTVSSLLAELECTDKV